MTSHASEIVIGIDFGTTYSGVSWAVNGGIKKVNVITNWPNPDAGNAGVEKVPSVISYENGAPAKWGYEVGPRDQSFKWVKLLLEPDSKYAHAVAPVKESNGLLGSLHKEAINVVADFLQFIWNYTLEDIRKKQGSNFRDIYGLKVVLTVPAMWSPAAKDKTLQAAKMAGLPDDIGMVTEPEAAALATLTEKDECDELKMGDRFVVCDAGGGTVDLISYEVIGTNPLDLEECATGDGDLCGSTFIDQGFEKWIRTQLGDKVFNSLKDVNKAKFFKEFEPVKRGFDPVKTQQHTLTLKGAPDNRALNIEDGDITVRAAVVRTVFDHVIGQIEVLIDKQIEQIRRNKQSIKAILLVGGFGESIYLYQRLEQTYKSQSISVRQVPGAWSAICRGATMWGLEHSEHIIAPRKTMSSRIARYSYGVVVSQPFDPSKHRDEDKFYDRSEGILRANNQMSWLLTRGQKTTDEQVLHVRTYESVQVGFFDSGLRNFSQALWYCEDEKPPTRRENNVKQLCEVNYAIGCDKLWLEKSFRSPLDKKKWRNCYLDILLVLQSANLGFAVAYKNEPVAVCEAKYPESV